MRRSAFSSKHLLPLLIALPIFLSGCFTELTSTSCENDRDCFRYDGETCNNGTCNRFRLNPAPTAPRYVWGRVIQNQPDANGDDIPIPNARVCTANETASTAANGIFQLTLTADDNDLRANADGLRRQPNLPIPPDNGFLLIELEPCEDLVCQTAVCRLPQ